MRTQASRERRHNASNCGFPLFRVEGPKRAAFAVNPSSKASLPSFKQFKSGFAGLDLDIASPLTRNLRVILASFPFS